MIKITYSNVTKEVEADPSASILDLVYKYFDCDLTPCAKKGGCGRCVCDVLRMGDELRLLSCNSIARDGDVINFDASDRETGLHKVESGLSGSDQAADIAEKHDNNGLHNFACIDLGTTSVVFYYKGLTRTCRNPQVRFGPDVISRMSVAQTGREDEIRDITQKCILDNLKSLDEDGCMKGAFIAANTAMIHFLMGYDTSSLGRAPFSPVSLGGESFRLESYDIYVFPGTSAFIGSDVVSGIYYVENRPGYDDEDYLLIDLGTNAEMVLRRKDRYICLSASAGPAFAGDAALDLEGSDMLSLIATGLRNGAIDRFGLLKDEFFEQGYPVNGHVLLQKHIRDIQLAKAAVACGAEYLLRYGNDGKFPAHIYITGVFGYHLKTDDIIETGLLPGVPGDRICVLGNSSLKGVTEAVKKEKTADIIMEKLQAIISRMSVISLPDLTDFGEKFYEAMNF